MNRILNCKMALITTLILVMANGASARQHKSKGLVDESRVVAHISFSQTAVDMAIQRQVNDKLYLFVQHSGDEGISVVDITEPAKSKIVGAIPWPNPALTSRMNVTGSIGIVTEDGVVRGPERTSPDVVLWDLSNPASPRVVQRFSGVVKWLQDERNFIYVLNGEGLWIVSEPVERQPEQVCSSNYGG
jgi:hypothetical protein